MCSTVHVFVCVCMYHYVCVHCTYDIVYVHSVCAYNNMNMTLCVCVCVCVCMYSTYNSSVARGGALGARAPPFGSGNLYT